ncbi:MAG: 7TM diverse intracellular signaling domain-containing protein, partial [Bacteroidota bacterium]
QGLFLGIILVMALYNLAIYFSVRDLSFLFYVCSILGLGFYFLFYYGFALELLWPFAPHWNAFSFVLFVPFTRISWVLFTRYYLDTPAILPGWNRLLDGLIVLYLVPLSTGLISYTGYWDLSVLTVNWIGSLGVIVLSMMLWLGYLAWRQGFAPARYFLLANIFFSLGTILFILRETGVLSDNFITIYSVQFGVVVQVVLFSLGLGNRLKEAREELLEKEMEKQLMMRTQARDKQKLIERQKADLEIQVSERTQDLEEKAFELEQTILRLKDSESKLKDLNNLKDKFFSIISHDLKSPIATLHSFLNILINHSGKISPQEFQELASKTQNATERLSLLLDNLLQWAMSQMKQLSFCLTPVDIEALVQENIDILGVSAEEKQIQIKKSIPGQMTILVDRNMLSFVLRNLMH